MLAPVRVGSHPVATWLPAVISRRHRLALVANTAMDVKARLVGSNQRCCASYAIVPGWPLFLAPKCNFLPPQAQFCVSAEGQACLVRGCKVGLLLGSGDIKLDGQSALNSVEFQHLLSLLCRRCAV